MSSDQAFRRRYGRKRLCRVLSHPLALDWDCKRDFTPVHGHRRSEPLHVHVVEKHSLNKVLVLIHVAGERYEREIGLASDVVALLYLWLGIDLSAKGVEDIKTLALHLDKDQKRHALFNGLRVNQHALTDDHTTLAKVAHTSLHRCDRRACFFRDQLKALCCVPLQDSQDCSVHGGEVSLIFWHQSVGFVEMKAS